MATLTYGKPLDMDGQKITNGAPGVAPTDFATVAQAGGGGGGAAELDYVETASGLSVGASSAAGAQTFLTGNAVTYDGSTRVYIEFFCPLIESTSGDLFVTLWEDATDLGILSQTAGPASVFGVFNSTHPGIFLTPSAGSHTYTIKAYQNGTATAQLVPGSGGAGVRVKAWLRITKA